MSLPAPLPASPSTVPAKRRAVFMDRDGTLNVQVIRDGLAYAPTSVAEFRLFPGVPEACRDLRDAGYILVVATNQPDVGRGTQSLAVVEAMHAEAAAADPPEIERADVCYATRIAVTTPPDPRRKPEPGMLLDAAREPRASTSARSWMIGDRRKDIDCGERERPRAYRVH